MQLGNLHLRSWDERHMSNLQFGTKISSHFHIAQMSLCLGTFFLIQGGPGFFFLAPTKNCHGSAR